MIFRTRDSGFNSEHPSYFLNSEHPSHTGSDIPSAIFGCSEIASDFLKHYGLDGPLAATASNAGHPQAKASASASAASVSEAGNEPSSASSARPQSAAAVAVASEDPPSRPVHGLLNVPMSEPLDNGGMPIPSAATSGKFFPSFIQA